MTRASHFAPLSEPRARPILRAFDLVLAVAIIGLAALPMLVIAVAIRIGDGAPVLFRQKRVGLHCEPFVLMKFRTMTVDPLRATGEISAAKVGPQERAKFQTATVHDSRVTRIGRILRRTHLDELPQLFNVIRGDMSLVGVRPDVPVQEADYDPVVWRQRHTLRPGITGLAQIDTDAQLYFASRLKRDLEWGAKQGAGLYFAILWGTFRKVLRQDSV